MDPPALSPEPTGWSQNEKEPIIKARAAKKKLQTASKYGQSR